MEHPLIGNVDGLTTEQLQTKIKDLNKKLVMATRSNNGYLVHQIHMALETFNNKYQEKIRQEWDRSQCGNRSPDWSDRIDIS